MRERSTRRKCCGKRHLRPALTIKTGAVHVSRLHQNTLEMPTAPSLSTLQHSYAPVKPPNISHLSPLPSTTSSVPTLILPSPCSDAEQVLPRNLSTAMRRKSSTSPVTTSSHSAIFDRSTLVSTLPSPRASMNEICHCTPTLSHDNYETSTCDSGQKLKCTRKRSASGKSPCLIRHIFPLCSPVENIPILQLPPSVSEAYCSPYSNNKSQTQDSALSSPAKSTHINDVPKFILLSSLPSISDDISALCLRSAVWEE